MSVDYEEYLPDGLSNLPDPQTDIPRIAKDRKLLTEIEAAVQRIQTTHRLLQGDSRDLSVLDDHSVHLIVTSPPYWTLKKYRDHSSQLGAVHDYDVFLQQLDEVWRHCFRVLVPGGRLVCVVGDTTLIKVPPPDLRNINEYSRGEHHAEVEDDPIGKSSDEELKGFCRLVLELMRGM